MRKRSRRRRWLAGHKSKHRQIGFNKCLKCQTYIKLHSGGHPNPQKTIQWSHWSKLLVRFARGCTNTMLCFYRKTAKSNRGGCAKPVRCFCRKTAKSNRGGCATFFPCFTERLPKAIEILNLILLKLDKSKYVAIALSALAGHWILDFDQNLMIMISIEIIWQSLSRLN